MLGLPMTLLSWFLFSWMFEGGEINREDDHKVISSRVKELKKGAESKREPGKNLIYDKWMWFGSGFYGLAGLWTLLVIEVREFIGFLLNISSLSSLAADGLITVLIDFLISQLGNILQAFLWFSYWPTDSMLIWVAVAYLGYWVGVEIGRRYKAESLLDILQHISTLFASFKK